jgi:uncharacterized protein (TIGR01777 family)
MTAPSTTAPSPLRIAITGATGFIGRALVRYLESRRHAIVRISRRPPRPGRDDVQWDPAAGRLDGAALGEIDAAIHLAGESISERWTTEHRREIRESRRRGTHLLATTLAALARPPRVLVSSSAVGVYGDRGDEVLTEASARGAHVPGDEGFRRNRGAAFLAQVASEWEDAAAPAAAGIRVVHPRTGVVLGAGGGILARLLPPFRIGAGGKIGDGRQWMSWIALSDLVRVFEHLVVTEALRGPVNAVAPEPVTNADFARALGRVLHRPAVATVPAFAARLMFGEMADALLLAGQRVVPRVLLDSGFRFDHPTVEDALRTELAGHGAAA